MENQSERSSHNLHNFPLCNYCHLQSRVDYDVEQQEIFGRKHVRRCPSQRSKSVSLVLLYLAILLSNAISLKNGHIGVHLNIVSPHRNITSGAIL
mmetsp:Transcript_1596/g.3663  ORF Transcript_1596/g.3663 Transcript_1596/m.3663 type:complete len:95 (+) Transcript_1596:125-409(+)